MRTIQFFAASLILLFAPLSAQESLDSSSSDRSVSITVAPLSLTQPMAEVMTEIWTGGSNSLAILTGIGYEDYNRELLYTAGAQYNWYLFGNFQHGMQTGVELLYGHFGDNHNHKIWHIGGNSFSIGPYLGYKLVLNGGLTANAQLGYQLVYGNQTFGALIAMMNGDPPGYAWGSVPLLKANVGWSF